MAIEERRCKLCGNQATSVCACCGDAYCGQLICVTQASERRETFKAAVRDVADKIFERVRPRMLH